MRLLAFLATALILGMIAATVWAIAGSPGPVVLEMPSDVLTTEASDDALEYQPVGPGRKAAPDAEEVAKAADLLVNAKLPVLNLGGGVLSAEAWDEAKELAELLSMPVATTLVAKGVFPEDHPLSMGMGCYPRSRYASGASVHMNRKADVVLAVGNSYRLPNGTDGRPIPEGVSLIHVNADENDLNKQYQADVPILADDELVEVTPNTIRVRKRHLRQSERKRANRR